MIVRLRAYSAYLRACTYLLPLFAFAIARFVTWNHGNSIHLLSVEYLGLLCVVSLVWAIICEQHNLFTIESMVRERTSLLVSGWATLATYTVVAMTLYFSGDTRIPRGFVLQSGIALLILVSLSRIVFRTSMRQLSFRRPVRVLIVGTDHVARRASRRLRHLPLGPCSLTGFVHLPGAPVFVGNAPIWELEDVAEIDPFCVDEILLAVPLNHPEKLGAVLRQLEHIPSPVRAIVDLGSDLVVRESLYKIGRLQLLDMVKGPTVRWEYRVAKRTFDILFSALILLISAPIFALIACAVKLSSPGPVFFEQDRVGLHGKVFKMYKFRTMFVSSVVESDLKWTTKGDPRCTAVGAFLRKTSLDELPQFLNVFFGEMSVVGPRPERPYFVTKFRDEIKQYNKRHGVKVGITGWAQVNGWRGDTSIERRVEHDLYYMQHWSFLLDLQIIFVTLFKAMWGNNAY